MRLLLLLTAAAPLVLLAACATEPSGGGKLATDQNPAASSYGMFLAGQSALNSGRNGEASKFFDQARVDAGGAAMITERAFTSALLAGDIQKAALLVPTGADASQPSTRRGTVVVAV